MKTYEKRDGKIVETEIKEIETVIDIAGIKREIENLERQKSDIQILLQENAGKIQDYQDKIDELISLIEKVETDFPEVKEVTEPVVEEKVNVK